MDTKITRILLKAQRYKKAVVFAVIGSVLALLLIVGGLLVLNSEKIFSAANSTVASVMSKVPAVTPTTEGSTGVLEKSLLAVASFYIQSTIHQSDASQHVSALSCVAAIGGPSPSQVVDAVKSKLTGAEAHATLENLKSLVAPLSNSAVKGPGTCLQWMFNS